MTPQAALAAVADFAQESVVITTMASVGDWPAEADSPFVFHYMPSSMGQGPSLGLGLALARPDRRTIVLNGDGCMLMNLGSLVTIGHLGPRNLLLIVLDNGIYEVTGGQPHAGSGTVDYVGLARAGAAQRRAQLALVERLAFARRLDDDRFGSGARGTLAATTAPGAARLAHRSLLDALVPPKLSGC